MKLILGKRGSGKTTRLIDECSKDEDGCMVCLNDMIDHWNDRLSKIDVVTENGRHRRIEISIKEFEEG